MKKAEYVFGKGELYEIGDLQGKIYATSAACMSVWSDFLSFSNAHPDRMTSHPEEADSVVVLGCQVTDLAILNDLEKAKVRYKKYIGGLK